MSENPCDDRRLLNQRNQLEPPTAPLAGVPLALVRLPACSHGLVNMLVEPTFVAPLLTWPPLVLEFVLVHR